ncbi:MULTISPECIES: M48 family metalloprotease [unclassified Halomonas]|uniref:M48 family metalloprotease n=1 Tax=unclassified Halomonas TaxID=2609666 RepID=UPI002884662C|nr:MULTISPECIES: M48 family metalloprotease [unclassified Halomonas]MDT0501827.1 M48 family metalloprotease [Halomonas sp. PAR7]MDT0511869.1 M48 family metalloprotease [Halomonas sp. LES1]MDT0592943.1 M48 family metalloprotease [Halomonas sp. PAR8]
MPSRPLPRAAALLLGLCLALPAVGQWTEPAWESSADLPSLSATGHRAATSEEYRLGRAWLRQFRARAPEWQDPIAQAYVEALLARLASHAGVDASELLVTLVDSHRLNAFAVPGGVVGINAGLFAFADQEAELVSVLAHELGHLAQRHYSRGQARAEQTQVPAMAAMLAGMLIAAAGGGDAGIGVAMGSQAAFIQDQLSYSRRYEQEADRLGLQVMAEAGYDPESMVSMFRAMQRLTSLQGGTPPEFLLTHPLTESRISDTASRAAKLSMQGQRDGLQYHLVRARALLAIHRTDPDRARTRLIQGDAPRQAERYLAALISAERGDTDEALRRLDALAREQPDLTLIPATAAETAFAAGRTDDAIERSRRLLRLVPGHVPTSLTLAEAQLQRDPETAWRLLRDLADRRPEDHRVFALLAEAAGRSGREALGHLARAEHQQLTGRITDAIRQLGVARRVAEQEGNATAAARIEQRYEAFLGYRETLEKFR